MSIRNFAPAVVAVAAAGLALASCATSRDTMSAGSGVDLGPGGRAEMRFVVPAGGRATIDLVNQGPGRADFVVRVAHGATLAHGQLTQTQILLDTPAEETNYVAVVETYKDAGASFILKMRVDGAIRGAAVSNWKVTR